MDAEVTDVETAQTTPSASSQRLIPWHDNLWYVEGSTVSFYGFPFTTRMVIAKLSDGTLWVHSPIALDDGLQQQVDALGEVRYLIAPNHLHHLFLQPWQQRYPDATSYATKELAKKRSDLHFDEVLDNQQDYPWGDELAHCLVTGSPAMQECVFFHKASACLVVSDFIENFPRQHFKRWQQPIAQLAGILAPDGKMPLDWRLSFWRGRKQLATHLTTILGWQPQSIIMAHGLPVESNAMGHLKQAFKLN
ncbi:DUF4336 domain-containing protein [Aliagarivorans marinus]|uniref:DUF4336 domain-containing protein n=1 Tax=Aliagarivorans marinus TaxID=561965 RepID=UPI0004098C64|nr:DUF4336 domain-containing protein [Aliagarivorans marinus]